MRAAVDRNVRHSVVISCRRLSYGLLPRKALWRAGAMQSLAYADPEYRDD